MKITRMTQAEIDDLADDALNYAVRYIQEQLGIEHGDFAGIFFSDDLVQNIFAEYIRGEINGS